MGSAVVPTHPEVERFLRSDGQTFTVHGLNGINHARNFVSKYCNNRVADGYSITGTPGGRGSGAFVEITKSKAYFNSEMAHYKEKQQERARLQALLPNNPGTNNTTTMINLHQALVVGNNKEEDTMKPSQRFSEEKEVAPGQSLSTSATKACSYSGGSSVMLRTGKRPLADTTIGVTGTTTSACKALRSPDGDPVLEVIDLTDS